MARCGFIAIELLNSFVDENIINEGDKKKFLNSLDSITSEMIRDMNKDKSEFTADEKKAFAIQQSEIRWPAGNVLNSVVHTVMPATAAPAGLRAARAAHARNTQDALHVVSL